MLVAFLNGFCHIVPQRSEAISVFARSASVIFRVSGQARPL
jgi:hypothetical protein